MSNVVIKTESGETVIKTKSNDPHFSTILSMYDIHGVPDVVLLSGSTGDILDEEYETLKRVIDGESNYENPIMLSDINRIRYILDVSDAELASTYVDKSNSQEDRLLHYQMVSDNIDSSYQRSGIYYLNYPSGYREVVLSRLLKSEPTKESVALLYNASDVAKIHGKNRAEDTPWEDLVITERGRGDNVYNTILLFADQLDDPQANLVRYTGSAGAHKIENLERISILGHLLRVIPEDEIIFTPNFYPHRELILSQSTNVLTTVKYILSQHVFPNSNMETLEKQIGRYAMERLLTSSLLYLNTVNSQDEVMLGLVEKLEGYLGTSSE